MIVKGRVRPDGVTHGKQLPMLAPTRLVEETAMKIAIATCQNLPGWEIDDAPFHEALNAAMIGFEQHAWDDPSVDWAQFDACIIRTTWDYMPRREAFIDWARRVDSVSTLFNPSDVVIWNTHKRYLAQLEALGVKIAPTVWLEAGEGVDVNALLSDRDWSRGFIKPTVGANASDTLRFSLDGPGIERAQAHLDALLPTQGFMIQPYLDRVETDGELSAIYFDGDLSHAVQKIPVPGDYRVQDDHGASDFGVNLSVAQRRFADTVVKEAMSVAPGLGGDPLLYARVDMMFLDDGSLCLTELELVEPSLFFRHTPEGATRLASALVKRLS